MEFDVEIVLRDTNEAITETIEHGTEPRVWRELDVETVLKQILLAIDRVKNPSAASRHVALRGFSWIVEPLGEEVIIAKDNKAVVKLVALTPPQRSRKPGSAKGQIWMAPDFDATPKDFKEYM